MAASEWDEMAAWRDSQMGESGDLWHRTLIDPTLLAVLGPVRGLRVLDLACGNGYLTRRLRREGATRAVGIDSSIASIRLARRREAADPTGAEFRHVDAARLAGLGGAAFDRIVANMALMDIRDARGTVREAARLLAPAGRFVFSISHPCFDVDDRSTWVIERRPYRETISRRVEGYRAERPVKVAWRISEDRTHHVTSYHRTLATYARYLFEAGLGIVRMAEPAPTAEFVAASPQGPLIAEIPLHLVIEAARWDVPAAKPSSGRSSSRVRRPASNTARTRPGARPQA